jgi:PII-like signaling protein
MNIVGIGKRVRAYVGEGDLWHGKPLYLAILEMLRAEGCAGATATRGVGGFGAHSRIHTATILRLSEDLPIVVEWIDTLERIERVLPQLTSMVAEGLITVDEVEIVHYQHRFLGRPSGQ